MPNLFAEVDEFPESDDSNVVVLLSTNGTSAKSPALHPASNLSSDVTRSSILCCGVRVSGCQEVRYCLLAFLLFATGGALRIWPVFVLGRRFSGLVAIQPGHTLVTTGMYSVIRHPSYLGLLVNSLGWGLAFRSGVGVLLTALTMLPLLARIGAEERLLRLQFGDEYAAYCARTSR